MDYKIAGVDIEMGNKAVQLIKKQVAKTHNANVLTGIGSFGAFYQLPSGYKEPALISATDGVGTKLMLAIEAGIFDTVGIDLVAMSVNDLICAGAKPLFFLDYIACHKLNPNQIESIIKGIVNACIESDCSLVGGEMAEMNDLYKKNDFDLAGFAVGIVEKNKIIDGSYVKSGNFIYGLPSSGIHSNGFSLVRKIMTPDNRKKFKVSIQDLLTPTKLYVKPILELLNKGIKINAIAHITGGGIKENLIRVLPQGTVALIHKNKIPILEIFEKIQLAGNIDEDEMYKVFNMGIGMIIITEHKLKESKELIELGTIFQGDSEVRIV